jgi:hypothetical protein
MACVTMFPRKGGVTLVAKLKGEVREIDVAAFTEIMNALDFDIDDFKEKLFISLESKNREGIVDFLGALGRLGRSVLRAITLVCGKEVPLSPFYFEMVFSQAMETVAEESDMKEFFAERTKKYNEISEKAGFSGIPSKFSRLA